ncbi:penicillin-binding protein 2 [Thiomicrospira sp. WB1]|uniref:penicillin-binding protein 2 n=1 Tax=Thiomicrospira sp. WB1 TaxID=1685380 RepID=UPI0007463C78|nr:penicillin-binding protein 2 [Thiomicrospira sp. WB1]KUJ71551.1 penicillin-binding protein 2 [Thiomicrospira sp. WB1]
MLHSSGAYQTETERKQQRRLFRNRVLAAFALALLFFLILLARMAYLQWFNYNQYHALAEGNRISVEAISPVRGRIYDRNHVLLAGNRPVFALKFDKTKINDIETTLSELGTLLPNLPAHRFDQFAERFQKASIHRPIFFSYTLSEEEASRFAVNNFRFPGISLVSKLQRYYPHGKAAVHALGYVGRINRRELATVDPARYAGTDAIGKLGVEKQYESTLHGYPGVQQIETNANGRVIRKLETTPPKAGQDIQLALDIRLQLYIESLLADQKASVVVTNPNNGEILAYVSLPGYDPNHFVDGISQSRYQALLSDYDRPLINRVVNGQYPPGSTVKPFVALGAIEQNIISPTKKIFDPGYMEFKGHRYRDWKREGHGLVDMHDAVVQSCDTYFYELSLDMGIDMIHDQLYPFGFGHKTDIDLPQESVGILPSKAWKQEAKGENWYTGETIIAIIGQGYFLTTPIQLAKAISTLANYGEIVRPHLNLAAPSPDKQQIPIQRIENWDQVIDSMVDVLRIPRGTAWRYARDIDFPMAGKTGTSQVFSLGQDEEYNEEELSDRLLDHSLFVGFAPVKNPEIAVTVVIENAQIKAADMAVKIADYYMNELRNEN